MTNDVHHLLWTSGWDSTFRLLDLLLVHRRNVQPYYLIDPARGSTAMEFRTRRLIRERLRERLPDLPNRLAPTVLKDASELEPDALVEEQLQRLRQDGWLGGQYTWLAGFARERDLTSLEVSFNQLDRPRIRLKDDVVHVADSAGGYYRLADRPANPGLEIFRRFRFPTPAFDLSKPEMQRYAEEHGFADLMELTWFCHTPREGRPCGRCAPCRDIVAEGLGRRLPWQAKLRYRLSQLWGTRRTASAP